MPTLQILTAGSRILSIFQGIWMRKSKFSPARAAYNHFWAGGTPKRYTFRARDVGEVYLFTCVRCRFDPAVVQVRVFFKGFGSKIQIFLPLAPSALARLTNTFNWEARSKGALSSTWSWWSLVVHVPAVQIWPAMVQFRVFFLYVC